MAINREYPLAGLAEEWESTREIRDRIRVSNALFLDTIGGQALQVNIRGAEKHEDVLTPLLKRIVTNGHVGMCSIPDLEVECLGYDFPMEFLCVWSIVGSV